jgi:hypothetical protein
VGTPRFSNEHPVGSLLARVNALPQNQEICDMLRALAIVFFLWEAAFSQSTVIALSPPVPFHLLGKLKSSTSVLTPLSDGWAEIAESIQRRRLPA